MLQENPSSPSSGKTYSELQYKKILAEFMEILIQQSIPNFQLTILNYPIVDQAMVKILQNLLQFKNSINSHNTSFQVLRLLCENFQVTVTQHGNCYKFQQSDIFLYQHSRTQFYIAYLNEMAQVSDTSDKSQNKEPKYEDVESQRIKEVKTHEYLSMGLEKILTPIRRSHKYSSINLPEQVQQVKEIHQKFELNEIKTLQSIVSRDDDVPKMSKRNKIALEIKQNDCHESSFINELHALEGEDCVEINHNRSEIPVNSKTTISKYQYHARGYKSTSKLTPTDTEIKGTTTEHGIIKVDNQSIVKRISSCEKKFDFLIPNEREKVTTGKTKKTNLQTQTYRPYYGLHNYQLDPANKQQQTQKQINKQLSYKQSNSIKSIIGGNIFYTPKQLIPKSDFLTQLQSMNHKKQKQMYDSIGTLYRQFTETKILDALPEKVRQNIRKMKSKYKGVHSKDFFSGKVV